jgi:hypothetical protein
MLFCEFFAKYMQQKPAVLREETIGKKQARTVLIMPVAFCTFFVVRACVRAAYGRVSVSGHGIDQLTAVSAR